MMNKDMFSAVSVNKLNELNDYLDNYISVNSVIGLTNINGQELQQKVIEFTPTLASKILNERNTLNRKINKLNVNLLAKVMESGKFKFNGENIKFNTNGILSDGQHRLLAVVNSNTTQKMAVITGIEETSFETIDSGFNRSASDILSINKVSNPKVKAATVKFIYAFRNGKYSANRVTLRNLSNQDIMSYYETLDNLDDSVEFISETVKNTQKLISNSTLIGLHYEMSLINEDDANTFISKVCTGVDLSIDSPITALRYKLIQAKTNKKYKLTNQSMLENVVQAWNHFRSNTPAKKIKIGKDFIMELK